jgi:BON domain-containing protein
MKTDLERRQDVEKQLSWNPKVEASKIAMIAKDGVVTLTGEVRNYFDNVEAEGDVMPLKEQVILAIEHNIAQFQMQIKLEGDASKRAALEELLALERVKQKNILRFN